MVGIDEHPGTPAKIAASVDDCHAPGSLLLQMQSDLQSLGQQVQAIEDRLQEAAPLDKLTCCAVEARLSVLEDELYDRRQQVELLQQLASDIEGLRARMDAADQHQFQQQAPDVIDALLEGVGPVAMLASRCGLPELGMPQMLLRCWQWLVHSLQQR
eukprot:gene3359-3634_t